MKKNQEPKKTKYLLKAHIKLHPTIKEPINKGTEIFSIILVAFVIIAIAYLLIETIFVYHPESKRPTNEEIEQICDSKNMEEYGYTTQEFPEGVFAKNHSTRTYIICKTPYPPTSNSQEYKNPECCYPNECSQAINNPAHCNCIYLIYCYQKSGIEQIEWHYRLSTK